jgi:DNA-binding transcriptional regulator YbjK
MRSSALNVIDMLKKEYVTDPEIIKQLDIYMKADDIPRLHSLVKDNMKHYAAMVSDIIDNLAALKKGVPSFLIPEYIKKGVDETITEANELCEKLYNYSNEYEADSNN